jgi:hypothetical protein
MTDAAKLKRLKDLLTAAESFEKEGNEAAAATYRDKAYQLAEKYGFEQAELVANGVEAARKKVTKTLMLKRPFNQQWYLLGIVSRFTNTYALKFGRDRVKLYGYENDVERCMLVFDSLCLQAYTAVAKAAIPAGEHPPTFRRGWWQAFAVRVSLRIQALERHELGKQIAVRDDAEAYARSLVKNISKGRPQRTNKSYEGRTQGYQAAGSVRLGLSEEVANDTKELK